MPKKKLDTASRLEFIRLMLLSGSTEEDIAVALDLPPAAIGGDIAEVRRQAVLALRAPRYAEYLGRATAPPPVVPLTAAPSPKLHTLLCRKLTVATAGTNYLFGPRAMQSLQRGGIRLLGELVQLSEEDALQVVADPAAVARIRICLTGIGQINCLPLSLGMVLHPDTVEALRQKSAIRTGTYKTG